eukprot:TRINITY_DN45467_c0_g1_i1.p2 TRINITY_DN45467_c0_g1~~TRINITY_DN45467_c0_g1_i1.p2  ORF type:complete len:133 (+),score=40.38 TRINITY_DN45467_c0_g1_i1:108-506(+)
MAASMQRTVLAAFLMVLLEYGAAENEGAVPIELENADEINTDGELSGLDGIVEEFDSDGDGKVSMDEAVHVLVDSSSREADETEEGIKDRANLRESVQVLFAQVDDGDGFLSEEELSTLFEKILEWDEQKEL